MTIDPLDPAGLDRVPTYEGATEMHRLVLGQALTGHAAFRH